MGQERSYIVGWEGWFQRYRGMFALLVRGECQRRRSQETGNLAEGARQTSFEKLRFGELKLLLEYCVLHDTTHQNKEQGGMAHGDSWE